MLPYFIFGLALASAAAYLIHRWLMRSRERSAWASLAEQYPASEGAFDGVSFGYPESGGEAVIGMDGFRAQPADDLPTIEVPWSDVRAVRPGEGGGLRVHLKGGMVKLPGSSSAEVASIIKRRAERKQVVST